MTSSRLRLAGAVAILAVGAALGARLTPIYLKNLELQRFVEETTRDAANHTRPDAVLKTRVLEKAAVLGLPLRESNVQVKRPDGAIRIEARYVVRVDLPLYTVDLHFYPGAGSR
ncbi:MAG: hypothetical protein ACRD96_01060 [Bryobacteraceae bacterium]